MRKKNPHAEALGKKGGKARWAGQSVEARSRAMRDLARKRWAKKV